MPLVYYYATMSAGKSAQAIQHHYNLTNNNHKVVLLTMNSREGGGVVASRIGVSAQGLEITDGVDLSTIIPLSNDLPHTVIADEAQFYSTEQIDYLAELANHGVMVMAFGLRTDFRSRLFPGSKRLFELADRFESIQTENYCWCGRVAMFNARICNGEIVYDGPQILIGDLDEQIGYRVLCRVHYQSGRLTEY